MPSEDSKPVKQEKETEDKEEDDSLLKNVKNKPNANAGTPKSRPINQTKPKKEESDFEDDDDDFTPIAKKGSTKTDKVQKKNKVKAAEEVVEKKKKVKKEQDVVAGKQGKVKKEMVEKKKKKKGAKEAEQKEKKRERKVYDLPGQKRDPPEERDPLRIFYESLYEQVPGSDMAAFWMMESGLLPKEVAKKVFEKKQKKSHLQKLSTPMKTVSTTIKKTSQTVTVKKQTPSPAIASSSSQRNKAAMVPKPVPKQTKKRKVEDESDDDPADASDDDDDFVLAKRVNKKQKAG